MTKPDENKTVVLGPEYDQRLRGAVLEVLARLGGTPSKHEWGIGGSQEVRTLEVNIGTDCVILEAETYIGLSVQGPAKLVDRISEMVTAKMTRVS